MKSNYLAIFFLLFTLLISPWAKAEKSINGCKKKQDIVQEYAICLDNVIKSVDRELQTWINNQFFLLEEKLVKSGRNSALIMFKRSHQNFISYRENNCRWQYLALSPSTKATPAYKKCYIFMTNQRINELTQLNK